MTPRIGSDWTWPGVNNVGEVMVNGKMERAYNRTFAWLPQPDITVYDLALCLPVFFLQSGNIRAILELPDNARRHFLEVTP